VGFCPPPGSVSACTTGTGIGGETIPVGSTTFIMEKNGSPTDTSSNPWFLLVAIPDFIGTAPMITSTSFTQNGSAIGALFFSSSSGSIYDLFGLTGDASMNASSLFGANEQAAFGGTPTFFEVFEYSFSGAFGDFIPYTFSVGGGGLSAGTFLAASGGSNPFSTPYTTAGLVNGPNVPTPEPGSVTFLGVGLLGLVALLTGRRVLTV
jgi:hypothetical protein